MIQYFKEQKVGALIYLFLLLVLIQLNAVSFSPFREPKAILPLLLILVVLFTCALLLNSLCDYFHFFTTPSNLPAFAFVVLSGFFPYSNEIVSFYTVKLALFPLLILLVIVRLIYSYQKSQPEQNYFDVGFLFGILTTLEPMTMLLFPAILLAIVALVIPKTRYVILVFVAFLMPWILYLCGVYLLYGDIIPMTGDWIHIELDSQLKPIRIVDIFVFIIGIILFFFWSSRSYLLEKMQRPFLVLSSILGVFGSLLFMSLQTNHTAILIILAPLSILLSFFFYYSNRKLANLLLFIFVGIIVSIPWFIKS